MSNSQRDASSWHQHHNLQAAQSRGLEPSTPQPPEQASSPSDAQPPDYGNVAYQLLLLQQRLESYEQLHRQEIAELRREMEKLRQEFLLETDPYLRAVRLPEQQVKEEA